MAIDLKQVKQLWEGGVNVLCIQILKRSGLEWGGIDSSWQSNFMFLTEP